MRRKVAWLTLWMTLAFWYGCAQKQIADLPPDYRDLVIVEDPDVSILGVPDPSPSITGLERNWEPIVVAPAPGYVLHSPAYLATEIEPRAVLTRDGGIDAVARNVTQDDSFRFNYRTYRDLIGDPLEFGYDMVTLPLDLVRRPPWTTTYSPDYTN